MSLFSSCATQLIKLALRFPLSFQTFRDISRSGLMLIKISPVTSLFDSVDLPKFRANHARFGENGSGDELQIDYLRRLMALISIRPIVGR